MFSSVEVPSINTLEKGMGRYLSKMYLLFVILFGNPFTFSPTLIKIKIPAFRTCCYS